MENKGSPSKAPLSVDSMGLMRLSRLAEKLELSYPIRNSLKHAVLDGIDAVFTDVRRRDVLTPTKVASSELSESKQDKYSSWTVEKLEYHIRRAVEADVPWKNIEPYAWKMFDIDHSAMMAGKLVELSYLQGGLQAAIETMETLSKMNMRYFQHVHERLKIPLIVSLWCRTEVTLLTELIADSVNEAGLSPLERYFAFWQSLHGSDPGRPVMYYQKHKAALHAAAEEYGDKVGFSENKFLLVLGRLHLELGMEENARILLEKITTNAKEYSDALDTLLKLKITKNNNGHSIYAAKLNAEPEWQKRIHLLNMFFVNCRRLGSFRDKNRPALNEVLVDPLKWFPKTVEAWSALSEIISENFDLQFILPELTRIFRENAFVMHSPELDKALWSGIIAHSKGNRPSEKYFLGVAKLHYYLASASPTCEKALWDAKELVDGANTDQSLPYAKDWQDFHRFSFQYVAKSVYHTEKNREQQMRQLKVATDARLLAMSDISRYLEDCKFPSLEVLTNLQYIAKNRMQHDIETEIILRRAKLSHLTNRDIENIWSLAVKQNDWDMAWRSISILQQRKKVNNAISQAWQISGEKRSFYPLINLGQKHLLTFVDDFDGDERKLVQSLLQVGPQIPELLSLLDTSTKTSKLRQYRPDSIEAKSLQFLDSLTWLPIPKKNYQFSLDGIGSSSENTPFFLNSMPNNQWSFIFQQLANRLGITSWNWKLSRLHAQIEDIIPRLVNRQDLLKSSTKISKWMRSLSPEQRSAWHDIAKLSAALDDKTAAYAIYRFLVRATTLICVNHLEALKSLYAMKIPVFIIWDYETWLLTSSYSGYRTALGLNSKVSVPRSLRGLDLL